MYRTARDTSSWFNVDNKGSLTDKSISKNIGPGKYNASVQSASTNFRSLSEASQATLKPTALSSKTSWNTGQVPFGNGASRAQFSTVRTNTISGPGSYEQDLLCITKPTPVKGIELRTALKHQLVTAQ